MIGVAIVPLLAAVVGLLVFVLASNPKVSEVGKIVFWTSLLVVWFALSSKIVRVG